MFKVEVLGGADSQVLATLTEGSVFGEISLLGISGMNRRTADVRYVKYKTFLCTIFHLNEYYCIDLLYYSQQACI